MELRIALKPYRLAFRQPMRTAHGYWVEREGIWVRLESESGAVGFGEAAPVLGFGRDTVESVGERLAALGDRASVEALRAVATAEGSCVGFALASALGALGAVAEGTPLVGPDYLPVTALLPAGRAALRALPDKLELGFRTFKWKVGVADPADERVLLDDLVAELPEGSRLRLDANGAWERREAQRWLNLCAERPMIEWVEQPLPAGDAKAEDGLRGLAEDFPTKIALDESLAGFEDLRRWIDLGWTGVWVLKPALGGDPAVVAALVAEHRLDVVYSTALETAIGAKAMLRAAFAAAAEAASSSRSDGKPRALGTGVWPLFADRRFNGPTAMPFLARAEVDALDEAAAWAGVE